MCEIWKQVDGISWDLDGGKVELERLKTEGFMPVEPLKKEPIPESVVWVTFPSAASAILPLEPAFSVLNPAVS